ncbi:hypothetical protein CO046_03410 [Candidatus Peregrinibacteria bacterium CG_4_9_14_0_2_um_filter_53_11]|nr:MAG: hypothetical protein CO046_03410 [Candidatus Peregrinibacteria bacterium CG_4_9_14_0_2_um_filter_53_11]
MSLLRLKKLTVLGVLIVFGFGTLSAPFAQGFSFPEKYDLVAILVEQGVYADTADYEGLVGQAAAPLRKTTLKARVDRYAIDLQTALPGTRALIIQVDRNEKTENVAAVLQRLYSEGDPDEPGRVAYLRGLVAIGEVPLPVVNKAGNRFISMYPYTDFTDPYYTYNPETGDFEPSQKAITQPQPEIWHGVIRPTGSTQEAAGKAELASYFDKNHLYHTGDPAYANFNKRVFFQDYVQEEKNLNPTAYAQYQKFLEHQGDVAYLRYTRELFSDLTEGVDQELAQDQQETADLRAQLEASGVTFDDELPPTPGAPIAPNIDDAVDGAKIPDIITKISKMSDKLMARFYQLFSKYPNLINDFLKYTGRYVTADGDNYRYNVDSAVNLITAKDQFTMSYLKGVNDMVERQIDALVSQVQKDVAFSRIHFEVVSARRKTANGFDTVRPTPIPENPPLPTPQEIEALRLSGRPLPQADLPPRRAPPIDFINFSPAVTIDNLTLFPARPEDDEMWSFPASLNGYRLDQLTSVAQCTPYRGSQGGEPYSKAVEINRALDVQTAMDFDRGPDATTGRTPDEVDSNYACYAQIKGGRCEGYEQFAGCFFDGTNLFTDPVEGAQLCFPDHATDPILDLAGTREVTTTLFPPAEDYRACLNFRSEDLLQQHRIAADQRLEHVDNRYAWSREEKLQRIDDRPVPPADPAPETISIFISESGDRFNLTLADLLRGLGWNPQQNPDGWKEVLSRFLLSGNDQQTFRVPLNNAQFEDITIRLSREDLKSISSVMYHKEPTIETLNAQVKNLATQDLPVDNPRFVSFQNQDGEPERIVYPDLFKAASIDEYMEQVRAVEAQLSAQPRAGVAGGAAAVQGGGVDPQGGSLCSDCLTQLFSNLPERSENRPGYDLYLQRAGLAKVNDSVAWKNMDLDSKHVYISRAYIDARQNAYIGESQNGYELLYFNGTGDAGRYTFGFNAKATQLNDELSAAAQTDALLDQPYEDNPASPFDDPVRAADRAVVEQGGYDLFTWSPPPVSPWWERMKEWARDLSTRVSQFQSGDSGEDFYAELNKQNEDEAARLGTQSDELLLAPTRADQIETSRVAALDIKVASSVVVVGKKLTSRISLLDAEGQPVTDEFIRLTATIAGQGASSSDALPTILATDEDPLTDGYQLTVFGGSLDLPLAASSSAGRFTLTLKVEDGPAQASQEFVVVQNARLHFDSPSLALVADGQRLLNLELSAIDEAGRVLTQVSGEVQLSLSNPALGALGSPTIQLRNGRGEVPLAIGTKKGTLLVNGTIDSVDPGVLQLSLLPGTPSELRLSSERDVLVASPGSELEVSVELRDRYSNTVDANSAVEIGFELAPGSEKFAQLSSPTALLTNGRARVTLRPTGETGPIVLTARAPGLPPSTLNLRSAQEFSSAQVGQMQTDGLAVALLGVPGGRVTEADALGPAFIMSGKVQAATSLTTRPQQYERLFEVTEHGGVRFDENAGVELSFVPANNMSLLIHDTTLGVDLARLTLVARRDGQFAITDEPDLDKLSDGIYLRATEAGAGYQLDQKKGALRVAKNDSEIFEVQTNGFVRLFSSEVSVQVKDSDYLTLEVLDGGQAIAEVVFVQRFGQDVRLEPTVEEPGSDLPGVFVHPYALPQTINVEQSFSGNTTAAPQSLTFYDTTQAVTGPGMPGFGFLSFEDSLTTPGVGFTRDNKFALLFAAGETFGEANRPYNSDLGIVLGDPTVRVKNTPEAGLSFTPDTGKLVYAGSAEVSELLNFDYNTDGYEDILIVQNNGTIRLIQNNGGYDQLVDQGPLFVLKNGVQALTKVDINRDGQMDLVVAGIESCRATDTCIDIYQNNHGSFERHNLSFNQTNKIVELEAHDLNGDGFPELVLADTAGNIEILYNRNGTFDQAPQRIGNVGLQIDPRKNLVSGVLLRYSGMPQKDRADPRSVQKFSQLSLRERDVIAQAEGFGGFTPGAGVEFSRDDTYTSIQRDYIYANVEGSAFRESAKFAEDLNGGVVETGDRVRYRLRLANGSGSNLSGVSVSDVIATQFELDKATLKCEGCGAGELTTESLSGDPLRPLLITGLTLPARSSRTISYEVTYRGATEEAEGVTFAFSKKFTDRDAPLQRHLAADAYPDIVVNKEGNPTGRVRYYYTTARSADGRLSWATALSSPAADSADPVAAAIDPGLLADAQAALDDPSKLPASLVERRNALTSDDSDGDGLQDSIDDLNGPLERSLTPAEQLNAAVDELGAVLDDVAGATQAVVDKLTCDAGCIALPLNYAFFAPGFASLFGVPSGAFDIGLPVFGWGVPSLIPVWPPSGPAQAAAGGRFYISPTITGGVGFSVCMGPYGSPKNCYSFGINPLDLLPGNICDQFNSVTTGALARANSIIADANGGLTLSMSQDGFGAQTSREAESTGLGNYSLGSYNAAPARNKNVKVPGFPSVLTDWWDAQQSEILKAFDLPDLYIIYPSLDSLTGTIKPTHSFDFKGDVLTEVLTTINSMPLVDIQTQEVLFKIPVMTRKEIEKVRLDALQWYEDEKLELERWKGLVGCFAPIGDGNFANLDTCRFVDAEMNKMFASVIENVKRLDEWILFPKKVLQFRTIESFYLGQIVDYLDTVIEFTGGWIKRNTARIKQWRRAVRQMKSAIDNWKALFNLMVDYNESCDQCKTERYGLEELLLKIFVAIPSPPVIPLPKLPDIIIDVSKIQAGLTIEWPDVRFKPEPFVVPKLPRFGLNVDLTIPQFKIIAPAIPLIPKPPELPILPQLPPLNLPELVDIPPPPTLPKLPDPLSALISILKKVTKIYCIIKLGFVPTDEIMLKSRIEQITARGLSPVLPVDLLFSIEGPTISTTYVDQLVITAFTNLNVDLSYIQVAVEKIAEEANKFSTDLVKGVNDATKAQAQQIQNITRPRLNVPGLGGAAGAFDYTPLENETSPVASLDQLSPEVAQLAAQLPAVFGAGVDGADEANDLLTQLIDRFWDDRADYLAELEKLPREITLEATPLTFTPSNHPLDSSDALELSDLIAESELITPFQKDLKQYRDALVGYADNLGTQRAGLGGEELNSLSSLIADYASLPESPVRRELASVGLPQGGAASPELQKVGVFDPDEISWLDAVFEPSDSSLNPTSSYVPLPNLGSDVDAVVGRAALSPPQGSSLIAQLPGAADLNTPGQGGPTGTGSTQHVGLFYVDGEGTGRRLVNYTFEAGSKTTIASFDLDNDGDDDKIYSYGSNVFLKKNFDNVEEETRPTFRPADLEFWTIYELLPAISAPTNFSLSDEQARSVSFSAAPPVLGAEKLAGYELIARNSPAAYESPSLTPALRAHFIPAFAPSNVTAETGLFATFDGLDGEVKVNGRTPQTTRLSVGDYIETGEDSSVVIRGSEGTIFRVSPGTGFVLTQGTSLQLTAGFLEVQIPREGSSFIPAGTGVQAGAGRIRLRFFDGSDMEARPGSGFMVPFMEPVLATVKRVAGGTEFTGARREYLSSRDGDIRLKSGDRVHPLEVVTLTWDKGGPNERRLTLSQAIVLKAPDGAADFFFHVESGQVEVVRSGEQAVQPAVAGMLLAFGDELKVKEGTVTLNYLKGGETVLRGGERFILNKLEGKAGLTASLSVDPGFYYARLQVFDEEGRRSVPSEPVLFAPQVCGDTTAPFASAGRTEFTVAVGKALTLDASRSFDGQGLVSSYRLDLDTTSDSNNDGKSDNDNDIEQPGTQPRFIVGPYENVGDYSLRLIVLDEALNQGYQDLTVHVVTPKIVLEKQPLGSSVITGYVEPADANVPISIARRRQGTGWELLTTPSADEGGQYYTDAAGRFRIDDADIRHRLAIRDAQGSTVAEVNAATGRIQVLDGRYELRLLEAKRPSLPTRIGLFLKSNPTLENPLSSSYIIPDINTDTTLDSAEVSYTEKTVGNLFGVHIKPLESATTLGLSFKVLGGADPNLPGATTASKGGKQLAVIDVNGDIFSEDAQVSFRLKPAGSIDAPVVYEMLYGQTVVAEIYVAVHGGGGGSIAPIHLVESLSAAPRPRPRATSSASSQPFVDVLPNDPFAPIAQKLFDRGIIAGYATGLDGQVKYDPARRINRAEFTQITLKMLCIIPRDEAKVLPSPFYDVLDPKVWFYPVLKEGNIRGFIRGYLGEKQVNAAGVETTPFKPNATITRAEAVTVVLAALHEQNIIDLDRADFRPREGGQWYDAYIRAAQNLQPLLVDPDDAVARSFLITPAEAARPGELITRRQFAEMADRVLLVYDCFNPDRDADGINDAWELAQGFEPAALDPAGDLDGDTCSNKREFELGTDPQKADTDGGGVGDCEEIARGTNPLGNPYDDRDQPPTDLVKSEEGIYLIAPSCNICPCPATIESAADLVVGDQIFAAITGKKGLPIYAKSNEEEF